MWTFSNGACENRMEEIQGAAACSFNPPHTLQDSWSCLLLMFSEYNDSCKRDLVLDKARSIAFAAQRQSHDQPDLQCKVRRCGYQIKQAVGATWDWLPRCNAERKGFAGLGTLNDLVAQLRHVDRRRVWAKEAKIDIEDTYRERPPWEETQREVDPCDRDVWGSNVKSVMRAASQLPGGEPTDVGGAPAPASYIYERACQIV